VMIQPTVNVAAVYWGKAVEALLLVGVKVTLIE
jgi:hypothetical protein